MAVADLNGDGRLDLVTANGSSDDVSVLLGDGAGGFGPAQRFAAGDLPRWVTVADVNRDGIPDLVVANRSSNHVSVLLGNGDGTFQPQQRFVAFFALSVAVADFDGAPDLAVAGTGQVLILLHE